MIEDLSIGESVTVVRDCIILIAHASFLSKSFGRRRHVDITLRRPITGLAVSCARDSGCVVIVRCLRLFGGDGLGA